MASRRKKSAQSAHSRARASDPAAAHHPYKEALKEPWLKAYAEHGTIWSASIAVPVSRRTIHDWKNNDPEFAARMLEIQLDWGEKVETTVLKRAAFGDEEPVVRNGHAVKDPDTGKTLTVASFSDQIQMFVLEAHSPKYRRKIKHEIEGEIVTRLLVDTVGAINEVLPTHCPGCGTDLKLQKKVADHLMKLSEKVEGKS